MITLTREVQEVAQDLTTYDELDADEKIVVDTASKVTVTRMDANDDDELVKDFGIDYFIGDFVHRMKITPTYHTTTSGSRYGHFWLLSNVVNCRYGLTEADESWVGLFLGGTGNSKYIRMRQQLNGVTQSYSADYNYDEDTPYYIEVTRFGTSLTARVYSDINYTELLHSFTVGPVLAIPYRWLMTVCSYGYGTNNYKVSWTGEDYKVSDLAQVSLPNPQLDDSKQIELKTNIKIAMDGTIYSNIKTVATRKWLLDFPLVSQTEKDNLLSFLTTYSGETLWYTDWLGATRKVIVLNAPISFKEHKNGYSFTLEMVTPGVGNDG